MKNRTRALSRCPQKKAVCMKLVIRNPKKPNSARRKTTRVRVVSNGVKAYCGIPGKGHYLQKYSTVLIRGGHRRDLPGVKYVLVRGKLDFSAMFERRSKRSKYGAKKHI